MSGDNELDPALRARLQREIDVMDRILEAGYPAEGPLWARFLTTARALFGEKEHIRTPRRVLSCAGRLMRSDYS